jgi:hypothetical protein
MSRFFAPILLFTLLSVASSCDSTPVAETQQSNEDFVLLLPDSRNDAVHIVSRAGEYLGDLFGDDSSRASGREPIPRSVLESPRRMLLIEGETPRLWLASERSLSEWNVDGSFRRMIFSDTSKLEDPTGMVRVGDEVFVLSEDKSRLLVFDLEGALLRTVGKGRFRRGKDLTVGPDGNLYVAQQMGSRPGIVSVWSPSAAGPQTEPLRDLIEPDTDPGQTWWLNGIAFDEDGTALVTEFPGGRVERWDLARQERIEVLLESGRPGAFLDIERGPDRRFYLAGADGIRAFESGATRDSLNDLGLLFESMQIADRLEFPFSPVSIAFVPRLRLELPSR